MAKARRKIGTLGKQRLKRMKGGNVAKARARRKSAGMTIPVAVLAGFAPLAVAAMAGYKYNGWSGVAKRVSLGLTGFNTEDKKWYPGEMINVTAPIMAGILVHKFAGQLGINRALGQAGIPFIRI
jgi:hypothetical protein